MNEENLRGLYEPFWAAQMKFMGFTRQESFILQTISATAVFTADVASRYRIVMEGITADGYPGTATTTFEVK